MRGGIWPQGRTRNQITDRTMAIPMASHPPPTRDRVPTRKMPVTKSPMTGTAHRPRSAMLDNVNDTDCGFSVSIGVERMIGRMIAIARRTATSAVPNR